MLSNYPNMQIDDYVFNNGDRIRKIGSPDSYEILQEYSATYTGEGEGAPVVGYLVSGNLEIDESGYTSLLEIYRQNTNPQDNV